MRVYATRATQSDLETLVGLYRGLEAEMTGLHRMWPLADGLDEPVAASFQAALEDPATVLLLGWIENVAFGFLLAREETMLDQTGGERIGVIRLIYVEPDAREVAVGEVMREEALSILRERGLTKFDAHVLPGHRLAKNFFEAGGFAARSIVMHHDDDR